MKILWVLGWLMIVGLLLLGAAIDSVLLLAAGIVAMLVLVAVGVALGTWAP